MDGQTHIETGFWDWLY